jgi:hypothetical protein
MLTISDRALLSAAALLLFSASAIAHSQARPGFTGSWTGGQQMANFYGVIGPQEMVITQDASIVRIDRPYGRTRVSILLKLDGSETKLALDPGTGRAGQPSMKREFSSRATWEGNKLKIVSRFRPAGAANDVTTIETLSLDGDSLLVERSDEAIGSRLASPRGEMFQTSKLIYKRN